ncbi:APC family permease [Candidatus Saccharibacteria bacterium]|nr:APC family permease [Candidatus Saccharibacteria bacterium]
MDQNKGLKRRLSPTNVWAIAFGCIIGWGSFINPGKKFLPNSGVAGTAIAMFLGAIVMVIIARSYAYMVPKFPKAGGEFTFTKNCFGKFAAYSCGWFLVVAYLTNVPMNSTAIGLIVDGLDGPLNILKFGFHYQIAGFDVWLGEILLASGILILFGFLNIIGVEKAGFVQTILATLLAVCAGTLCIAGIVSAKAQGINMQPIWGFDKAAAIAANATTENIGEFAHVGTSGVLSAILATFAIAPWAFVGFDTIPQAAEEFKFSYKKVMTILVIAIAFGCFVYISNNTVAAAALTNWPDRVMAGDWVLLIAAEELLGTFGKVLIGVGVSCAVLSGIMGFYLASSRLMYSMSQDGFLPEWFGKIDARHGTPKNAMIFCVIVSLSGPILGREALGWFVDMSAIGASIGYFATCAATLKTMKRDHDGTTGLKVLAIAGVIFSAIFMILQLIPIPGLSGVHFGNESYIMLIIWLALGAVFYIKQRKSFQ